MDWGGEKEFIFLLELSRRARNSIVKVDLSKLVCPLVFFPLNFSERVREKESIHERRRAEMDGKAAGERKREREKERERERASIERIELGLGSSGKTSLTEPSERKEKRNERASVEKLLLVDASATKARNGKKKRRGEYEKEKKKPFPVDWSLDSLSFHKTPPRLFAPQAKSSPAFPSLPSFQLSPSFLCFFAPHADRQVRSCLSEAVQERRRKQRVQCERHGFEFIGTSELTADASRDVVQKSAVASKAWSVPFLLERALATPRQRLESVKRGRNFVTCVLWDYVYARDGAFSRRRETGSEVSSSPFGPSTEQKLFPAPPQLHASGPAVLLLFEQGSISS